MTTRPFESTTCQECGKQKPLSWRTCSDGCDLHLTRRELSRALAQLQTKTEEVQTLKREIEQLWLELQLARAGRNGVT